MEFYVWPQLETPGLLVRLSPGHGEGGYQFEILVAHDEAFVDLRKHAIGGHQIGRMRVQRLRVVLACVAKRFRICGGNKQRADKGA